MANRDVRVDKLGKPEPRQEYHVVSGSDENHLKRVVTEWIVLGWRPHGSPVIRQADGMFYQAMIKD